MVKYVDSPVLPDRYSIGTDGSVWSKRSSKFISIRLDRYGYPRVNLYEGTKLHTATIHRLITLAYIENDNPKVKKEVNHKDGNKQNNSIDNLEWVTSSENQRHAFDTGLQKGMKGESNGMAKNKEEDVIKVCEMLLEGKGNAEIRDITGYTLSFIEKLKYGETWTYLTKDYGIIPKEERATAIQ